MKTICIDYDGTYTLFPELLDCIIDKSLSLGYRVVLATMRYDYEITPGLQELINKVNEVVFTGRKAKLPYLSSKGIIPDIWIDDNPIWLLNDSK